MPYKSIHWIKLEKRLLNDYRYYSMPERARLMFVELLMVAAETGNLIPQDLGTLKTILRTTSSEKEIAECLKIIESKFPKFGKRKGFYVFKEWSTRTNQVYSTDNPGISQGYPADMPGIRRVDIDKIREEYIRLKGYKLSDIPAQEHARYTKAIMALLKHTKGDSDIVVEGLQWMNTKNWDWTIESLIKFWAEFLKKKDAPKSAAAKEADLSHIL